MVHSRTHSVSVQCHPSCLIWGIPAWCLRGATLKVGETHAQTVMRRDLALENSTFELRRRLHALELKRWNRNIGVKAVTGVFHGDGKAGSRRLGSARRAASTRLL